MVSRLLETDHVCGNAFEEVHGQDGTGDVCLEQEMGSMTSLRKRVTTDRRFRSSSRSCV